MKLAKDRGRMWTLANAIARLLDGAIVLALLLRGLWLLMTGNELAGLICIAAQALYAIEVRLGMMHESFEGEAVARRWGRKWKALARWRGWPASKHERTRRALQLLTIAARAYHESGGHPEHEYALVDQLEEAQKILGPR